MDAILRGVLESSIDVQKQKFVLEKIAATAKTSHDGTTKKSNDQSIINLLELSARLYLNVNEAQQQLVQCGLKIFKSWSTLNISHLERLVLDESRSFLTDVLRDVLKFVQGFSTPSPNLSDSTINGFRKAAVDADELRERIIVFLRHITDTFTEQATDFKSALAEQQLIETETEALPIHSLTKWVQLLAKNGGPLVSHLLQPRFVADFARILNDALRALRLAEQAGKVKQHFEFNELAYFYLFIGTVPISIAQLLTLLDELPIGVFQSQPRWSEIAMHPRVPDIIRTTAPVFEMLESAWNTLSYSQRAEHFAAALRISVKFNSPNGIALAHSTRLIDASQITSALPHVASGATSEVAAQWFAQLAETVVDWLAWPLLNESAYVALLDGLMRAIHDNGTSTAAESVLPRVMQNRLGFLIRLLSIPSRRKLSMTMLTELLTSVRCPARLFHSHIGRFCAAARRLKQDGDREALKQLAMLVALLMFVNPGYPTFYRPLEDAFDGVPRPSTSELRAFVDQHVALREKSRLASAAYNVDDSMDITVDVEEPTKYEETVLQPFVGLVNRGNTCYANVVIQSLFMSVPFRNTLLMSAFDAAKEPIAFALQRCFATLGFSRTKSMSPAALLSVSRPAWFEDGFQQDCVEYLVMLLDRVREQFLGFNPTISALPQSNFIAADSTREQTTAQKSAAASASLDKRCLVDRYFGGLLATTVVCTACNYTSTSFETCTHIALALPARCAASAKPEEADVSCQPVPSPNQDLSAESAKTNEAQSLNGSLAAPTSVSDAASLPQQPASTEKSLPVTRPTSVLTLLHACFRNEELRGTNQYHCERCNKLQDAVKRVRMRDAPPFLALNVLRFAFNRLIAKRTKRADFVRLDSHFLVRFVESASAAKPSDVTADRQRVTLYRLLAIVIHSGYSADAGHYYSYIRTSSKADSTRDAIAKALPGYLANAPKEGEIDSVNASLALDSSMDGDSAFIGVEQVLGVTEANKLEQLDVVADGWCLFNDESTETVEWSTLSDYLHKYRLTDTPYLLVYERSQSWIFDNSQLTALDESDTMHYAISEDSLPNHVRLFLEEERRKTSHRDGVGRSIIGDKNGKPPPPGPSCGAQPGGSDGPSMVF